MNRDPKGKPRGRGAKARGFSLLEGGAVLGAPEAEHGSRLGLEIIKMKHRQSSSS